MSTQRLLQWAFSITLIALLLGGYRRIDAQPRSGDWKVPTGFGEFVFTVSSNGTQIIKLSTTFSNFTCGGVTQGGTIISQPSPGWPISNNQFTIEKSVNPSGSITMTINGTFAQAGDQASGTWSVKVSGTICSGNWGPVLVAIKEVGSVMPERFVIAQNYPNPFNSSTTIEFSLPQPAHVSLKIFNTFGQVIATLVSEKLPAGMHRYDWNASEQSSGVYFYRLFAIAAGGSGKNFEDVKKLVLLK